MKLAATVARCATRYPIGGEHTNQLHKPTSQGARLFGACVTRVPNRDREINQANRWRGSTPAVRVALCQTPCHRSLTARFWGSKGRCKSRCYNDWGLSGRGSAAVKGGRSLTGLVALATVDARPYKRGRTTETG